MEALEVFIGLIFIYLLLSLLASIVQEIISGITSARGKELLRGIAQLLEYVDGRSREQLIEMIRNNKVYQKFENNWRSGKLPAYISQKQFLAILKDVLDSAASKSATDESGAARPHDLELQRYVMELQFGAKGGTATPEAEPPQTTAEKYLAERFEEMMDRVSGWYKHKVQITLFLIGIVIAIAFNGDTFRIYQQITANPDDRQELLALAESFIDNDRINIYLPDTSRTQIDSTIVPSSLYQKLDTLLQNEIDQVRSPVGLGWNWDDYDMPDDIRQKGTLAKMGWVIGNDPKMILGWLITALAISLGASFWFDLLQKVMKLRDAGRNPRKAPDET